MSSLLFRMRNSALGADRAKPGVVKPCANPLSISTASYRTPAVLQPIQLLDLLELSGSTTAAAEALSLSQPTVSRRVRHLLRDLGLERQLHPSGHHLRYGESTCLQLLRRASQAHRLDAGAWRLGSCPWQQGLVQSLQPAVSLPDRFRHFSAWRVLLEARMLDAVLVSGLDLQWALPEQQACKHDVLGWQGFVLVPISQAPLGLLIPPDKPVLLGRWSQVAVPAQRYRPGLVAMVQQQQWQCLQAAPTCHTPHGWAQWLRRQNRPTVATPAWAQRLMPHLPGWTWQPWPGGAHEEQWLLALRCVWDEQPVLQRLQAELRSVMRDYAVSA